MSKKITKLICLIMLVALLPVTAAEDHALTFDLLRLEKLSETTFEQIPTLESGRIRCSLRVQNYKNSTAQISLMMAFYSDGELLQAVGGAQTQVERNSRATITSSEITVNLSEHPNGYLKVFLWDGVMSPYKQVGEFKAVSTLNLTDSTYVYNKSADTNFASEQIVKAGDDTGDRDDIFVSYLKFPSPKTESESAVLNFYVSKKWQGKGTGATYRVVGYKNDWTGQNITYNTQASEDAQYSSVLGLININQIDKWYQLDVTPFVNRQAESDFISFKIEGAALDGGYVEIASDGATAPFITVKEGYERAAGAIVPFLSVQAEDGDTNGTIEENTANNTIASEAWGRSCVRLSEIGQYSKVTSPIGADRLTVRYSLTTTLQPPNDRVDIKGSIPSATLSLYINGVHNQDLQLSNKRMLEEKGENGVVRLWDEVIVPVDLNVGDEVKLQKDAADQIGHYYVDFFEFEKRPLPIPMPTDGNWISITDAPYNAVPNDPTVNNTNAIINCLNDAKTQNKNVWIPEGNFYAKFNKLSGGRYYISVPDGVDMRGAGVWYSVICKDYTEGGNRTIELQGNNTVSDFKVEEINGNKRDGAGAGNSGIRIGGSNCVVDNIWVSNTYGAGIIGYGAQNAVIKNCRVIGSFSDAIHLANNAAFNLVENCYVRNAGDDGFALIGYTYEQCRNNIVRYSTNEVSYWGRGATIQGGMFNTLERNKIVDKDSTGLLVLVESYSGDNPTPYCYEFLVQDNTVIRCGLPSSNKDGAIWVFSRINRPMTGNIQYNKILSSIGNGISKSENNDFVPPLASYDVNIRFNIIDKPLTSNKTWIWQSGSQFTPFVDYNILRGLE